MNIITAILLSLCVYEATASTDEIYCQHFWKNGEQRIPSGKKVGVDVGTSIYGPAGVYECKILIKRSDVLSGKLLYIGEVGDASYVDVLEGPRGQINAPPIYHGLSPANESKPRYERFIPFVVSLRDIYQADGWHRFDLHYLDIYPRQTGLRSGPPSIETPQAIVKRVILNAPNLGYHIFQIVVFLVTLIGILSWNVVPLTNRFFLGISAALSGAAILSITAIPRFFLEQPEKSVKANGVANMIALAFAFLPLTRYTEIKSERYRRLWILVVPYALVVSFIYCLIPSDYSDIAFKFYSVNLLVIGSAVPFALFVLWRKKIIRPCVTLYPSDVLGSGAFLLIFAAIVLWDAGVNMLLLNVKFQFFISHFCFYLPVLVWQIWLQRKKIEAERNVPAMVEAIKNRSLQQISAEADKEFVLDEISKSCGSLCESQRVSLIELCGDTIKLLGYYGDYPSSEKLQIKIDSSHLAESAKSGAIVFGFAKSVKPLIACQANNGFADNSEYFVIPLAHQGLIKGFLCLTNFRHGYLSPFLREQLSRLQHEVETIFSLLMFERDSRSQATLLKMARLSVHALQLQSEKYFLENFRVSETFSQPAFIIGDLVDSTPLNKIYGAQKTRAIIDEFINAVFEAFKRYGIILTCRNGDEVAIVIPNQAQDASANDVCVRAVNVIEYLCESETLSQIAVRHGVRVAFEFKYAAAQASIQRTNDSTLSSLGLLSTVTDSEIDSAFRVLSKVALPRECLILPSLASTIADDVELVQISKERLKGVSKTVEIYSMRRRKAVRSA